MMDLPRVKDPLLWLYSEILSGSLVFWRFYQTQLSLIYCPSLQFISTLCYSIYHSRNSNAISLALCLCVCLLACLYLKLHQYLVLNRLSACVIMYCKSTFLHNYVLVPFDVEKFYSFSFAFYSYAHILFSPTQSLVASWSISQKATQHLCLYP